MEQTAQPIFECGARHGLWRTRGDLSGIRETKHAIWSNWHQNALIEPVEGMPDFEYYGDRFDAKSGSGVVEIWIGAKAKV